MKEKIRKVIEIIYKTVLSIIGLLVIVMLLAPICLFSYQEYEYNKCLSDGYSEADCDASYADGSYERCMEKCVLPDKSNYTECSLSTCDFPI